MNYPSWESVSEERWTQPGLVLVGTLRDVTLDEPTFEEYHPEGTRYDSPLAPISVTYFPYNRSDLWRCERCQRYAFRYTEFGGYYVDHRVRSLTSELIAADNPIQHP